MKKTIVDLCVLVFAVFSFACNDSSTTPSSPQTPALTVTETNMGVALNFSRSFSISGGKGNYSLKSTTDSTVVSVNFYSPFMQNGTQSASAILLPLKLGTAVLTIQDSAKSAEVKITVTVSIMATDPSFIKVRAGRDSYFSIRGGTPPYSLLTPPNPAIATVAFTAGSSYASVTGVTAGSTSVTFRDNANPTPHTITIPIEVTPAPQFTTAGKISFSSGKGEFSANGIAAEDISLLPANSEGAGCWIFSSTSMDAYITIAAYRKKSVDVVDVVSISFSRQGLTAGSHQIDTTDQASSASVVFVFDGNLKSPTADVYRLTSGTLDLTTLNTQSAKGSFSGNAVLTRGNTIYPGTTTTVSNGLFDVPVIVENFTSTTPKIKDKRLKALLEKATAASIKKFTGQWKR
ncbi:MAG: hypothetical protein ACOYNS_04555 [Bacteroidota bacterium]